jgi:hypothetical protein
MEGLGRREIGKTIAPKIANPTRSVPKNAGMFFSRKNLVT